MPERNLNFDTITDRRNTKCLKYDFAVKRGYPKDVLPLWVADMDLKTSSYVWILKRPHMWRMRLFHLLPRIFTDTRIRRQGTDSSMLLPDG